MNDDDEIDRICHNNDRNHHETYNNNKKKKKKNREYRKLNHNYYPATFPFFFRSTNISRLMKIDKKKLGNLTTK